jgi:hypothetical protein
MRAILERPLPAVDAPATISAGTEVEIGGVRADGCLLGRFGPWIVVIDQDDATLLLN